MASPDNSNAPYADDELLRVPHPYIKTAQLAISGIAHGLSNKDLAEAFSECLKVRFEVNREHQSVHVPLSGSVSFDRLKNAEKAFATVQGYSFPAHECSISLSIPNSPDPIPTPTATPRIIKHVPASLTAGDVFDRFRVFGPIHKVAFGGRSPMQYVAIEYYDEQNAAVAEEDMNYTEIDGMSIVVEKFDTRKASATNPIRAEAAPFIPTGPAAESGPRRSGYRSTSGASMNPSAPTWNPSVTPRRSLSNGSTSPPTTRQPPHVDLCNLFIKNLDPNVTSQDLFSQFKRFGRIVSARVMRNEHGVSKEFGFVSFDREEDTSAAQREMDGVRICSKDITVRFHEPKRYREARIRGGGNPTPSEIDPSDLTGRMANLSTEGFLSPAASPTSNDMSRQISASSSNSSSPPPTSMTQTSVSAEDHASGISGASERDRLLQAIRKIDVSRADEVVDLLASLPKKDRALCLFNSDVLRSKMKEAMDVLRALDDDGPSATANDMGAASLSLPTPAATPSKPALNQVQDQKVLDIAALSKLPAVDIIKIAQTSSRPPYLSVPDQATMRETDEFVDSLSDKATHVQKQKVGDKLFKVVKTFGVKGAPKITIKLLDTEDLRSLAHLMNQYPNVLKEKVLSTPLD